MLRPKRIFVDSSGWIELLLQKEIHHEVVAEYFLRELEAGSKFFTNDYVLDETWTRLITQKNLKEAKVLRNNTRQAEKERRLLILWTDETLFEQAWKNFVKFAEHKLSFTDAVIATVAQDIRIDEILTLDQGFRKIGFITQPNL